eukprot:806860-Pyramimonas_sp.AAC.1
MGNKNEQLSKCAFCRRRPNILILCVRRPPGATRAPIIRAIYASWRALSGHTAPETIYRDMDILYVRVGRAPPRRTDGASMSLCVPLCIFAPLAHP